MWRSLLNLALNWNERNSSLMSQYKLIRVSLCSLRASASIYLEPPTLSREYLTPYWMLPTHILCTATQHLWQVTELHGNSTLHPFPALFKTSTLVRQTQVLAHVRQPLIYLIYATVICTSYSIKILFSVQGNTEDHSKGMIKINEVRNTKGWEILEI